MDHVALDGLRADDNAPHRHGDRHGTAGAFRKKFPRWVVAAISFALLIANTINIASDLSGMADAAHMLGGGPAGIYIWVFGLGICALTMRLNYHQIAGALKWLALALFGYVITAFLVKPAMVRRAARSPRCRISRAQPMDGRH